MYLVNEGNFYAAVCCIMFQLGTLSRRKIHWPDISYVPLRQ